MKEVSTAVFLAMGIFLLCLVADSHGSAVASGDRIDVVGGTCPHVPHDPADVDICRARGLSTSPGLCGTRKS